MTEVKLTPVQNKVVWCVQNGWVIVTSNEGKGAVIGASDAKRQFHINNGVFWNLVHKGMIYQQTDWPFHYVLTNSGRRIKTTVPKDFTTKLNNQ